MNEFCQITILDVGVVNSSKVTFILFFQPPVPMLRKNGRVASFVKLYPDQNVVNVGGSFVHGVVCKSNFLLLSCVKFALANVPPLLTPGFNSQLVCHFS